MNAQILVKFVLLLVLLVSNLLQNAAVALYNFISTIHLLHVKLVYLTVKYVVTVFLVIVALILFILMGLFVLNVMLFSKDV